MTGSIELDPDGKHLQIRFAYRPDLVERVKTLQGRRWDRDQKIWRVPKEQVSNTVALFMSHGFTMTSDVSSLLAGTAGEELLVEAGADTVVDSLEVEDKPKVDGLSISALNTRVQSTLRDAFPEPVWVVGEILDYDKSRDREHIFFKLVEKMPFGERLAAEASIALFNSKKELIQARIAQTGQEIELHDGLEIRVLVRVDLYTKSGRYQIVLEDIDPAFTLGKMALNRERILQELRKRGIERKNLDLPFPRLPLRIGVLTSPDSDGWIDFKKELQRSKIGFGVTLFPVKVQGELLEWTMIKGLEWFTKRAKDFDVLCILRGGGSGSDLAWFDNRLLAIGIAKHPLKIVCGIGHERDRCVLDEITHSEKTPTAVGTLLVTQVQTERVRLRDNSVRFVAAAEDRLTDEQNRLTLGADNLRRLLEARLVAERRDLQASGQRLALGTQNLVAQRRTNLHRRADRLVARASKRITAANSWLANQETRQRLLNPVRVLERGYTLARDADGRILTSIEKVSAGSRIEIQFRDGRARSTVDDTERKKPDR